MLCVYKIKFNKSSFELDEDYERFSDIDKEKIADLVADSFFDYEEDDAYAFFAIAQPTEVKRYLTVLSENLVTFELNDISNSVLKGEFDFNLEVGTKINPIDATRFSFFIDELNDWIYNNLDIDIILDRISKVGINNITQIEKDFLNNYNV